MLLRPQEESTEIETYLNPLFTSHPDIFLQPINPTAQNKDQYEKVLQYLVAKGGAGWDEDSMEGYELR